MLLRLSSGLMTEPPVGDTWTPCAVVRLATGHPKAVFGVRSLSVGRIELNQTYESVAERCRRRDNEIRVMSDYARASGRLATGGIHHG
ncbi:hypothetical protein ARTHRO9V_170013 [Arthrobacter sp. 9V]|nr:hypothetical protein ARTHRO9V_170013 [Arthrobacter sp. 9V]